MPDLIPFSFESHSVRAFNIDGNPWFVGKDACDALGYKDTVNALKLHCKGVAKYHPLQTPGGVQEVRIINEPDIYRLITGSHLPEAERFEKWLFEEVLPTIRKTGSYSLPGAGPRLESRPEYAQLHALLKDIDRTRCPFARQALVKLSQPLFEALGIPMPSVELAERPAKATESLNHEPDWRRILLTILQEIEKGRYVYPYAHRHIDGVDCLVLRTSHIMEYLSQSQHLAAFWKSLWLHSDRVLKRQLIKAGLIVRLRNNPVINHFQFHHAVAINLQVLHSQAQRI